MPHHQLRSRVIRLRFVAVAALLNLVALVVVGFLPKDTHASAITPYAAALNAVILVSGIGIVAARRKVHGVVGIAGDLATVVLTPTLLFLLLANLISLIRSDPAAPAGGATTPETPARTTPATPGR